MEKNNLIEALKKIRAASSKRNFKQSFDLIINLKDLDLKKPEEQVDLFVPLHFKRKGKVSVCGLVGPELMDSAKEAFQEVVNIDEFQKYQKDPKLVKKLAKKHDFFVAQANIMPKVAGAFGKGLGPRGKMPNPKAGCVVPPNANLKQLYARLELLVRVSAKTAPVVRTSVGTEEMSDEEIADNFLSIYTQVVKHLPNEQHNIKNTILKLTMGAPFSIDPKGNAIEKKPQEPKEKPKAAKPKQEKSEPEKKEEVKKEAAEKENVSENNKAEKPKKERKAKEGKK